MVDSIVVERDIVPLFVFERGSNRPKAFVGTGFIVVAGVLVTCWHVVRAELHEGQFYGAAVPKVGVIELKDVTQDRLGRDLATARVDATPAVRLPVAQEPVPLGTDVLTFGYPLTRTTRTMEGEHAFHLEPRYLEGYVTRAFAYDQPAFGVAPSYELDMLAPAGISGAPIITRRSPTVIQSEIIGVVYSSLDSYTVAEEARVDSDTDEATPEVRRVVPFALARYTTSLRQLAGAATGDRPLSELL